MKYYIWKAFNFNVHVHTHSTVQNECWRRVRAEGTCSIGTGGPNASDHAAGQGNLLSTVEMSSV